MRQKTYVLLLLFFLIGLPLRQVYAAPDNAGIVLSVEERAWLAVHPDIELFFPSDFEPALIVEEDGRFLGFLPEILTLVNQRLGTDIRPKTDSLLSILQKATDKKIAGSMALDEKYADELGLLHTKPYLKANPVLFMRNGGPVVNNLEDLSGKTVAIMDGVFHSEQILKPYMGKIRVIRAETPLEALTLVYTGKADAMLGLSIHSFLITQNMLLGLEAVHVFQEMSFDVVMAIRPDWPQLVGILNKGLALTSNTEVNDIVARWVGTDGTDGKVEPPLELSTDERRWIRHQPVVRVGFPAFPPISFQDDDGRAAGITADYLEIIRRKTGLAFEPVHLNWPDTLARARERKIDLFAGINTLERQQYLNFSAPFYKISYVVINRLKAPFVSDLSSLEGQNVAVIKNVALHKLLEKEYPDLRIVPFENLLEALKAVSTGQAEAYVGDLMTASYQIQEHALLNLKVAAPALVERDPLSLATRKDWPVLAGIIDKAVRSISREEHDKVLQKWLRIRFERGVDWSLVRLWTGSVGALFGLIIFLAVYWNRRLMQEVAKRTADLQESEMRYRVLIERASDAIYLLDQAGKLYNVNQRACDCLGYSREELLALNVADFSVNFSSEPVRNLLSDISERGGNAVVEGVHKRKDGSLLNVEVNIAPLKLGEESLILSIVRDVTMRKKIEETLYFVSQKGWKVASPDFFPELSIYLGEVLQSDYVFVARLLPNRERVRTLGLCAHGATVEDIEYDLCGTPCATVIGRRICSYVSGVRQAFPEDELLARMEADSYVGAPLWNSQGEPIGLIVVLGQKPLTNLELTESLLQVVAVRAAHELERLQDEAEIERYQLQLEDLVDARTQDLKAARLNLQLALDSVEAGTFYRDALTDELSWDQRSLDIFGMSECLNYESWSRAVHPDDLPGIRAQIERDLKTEQVLDLHYRIVRPDGEIRNIWAIATIIRNTDGELQALSGLHFDETDKLRNEAELLHSKEVAELANQAKSDFLSNISHELRTPLTGIIGYSQLLRRDGALPEKLRKKVDIITQSGKHLHELINDVLEVSRIEAGHLQLESSFFDLHLLLREIEEMFRLQTEEKGLQLTFEKDETLPTYITADQGKLRQVLINLLGNAVKFTDSGSISVYAGVQEQEARLIFSVKDTGFGIAADERDKLFAPFEQAMAGKSRGGTGLGLMISLKYAQLMGGELDVSSEPRQGSIFTFTCCVKWPQDKQSLPIAETRTLTGFDLQGGQKTLLVVDDIQETRLYLSQLLRTAGLRIVEAQNGAVALEKIAAEQPDLVIMDMRMAVMNGYEAIRRLRSDLQLTTPVIAASASAFESDRKEIMATGADEFIRKPFDDQEVLESVARILGARRVYSQSSD
jgi:PAS domain S-box-containing protein